MSEPDCTDVCEAVIPALKRLGFKISDDTDHTDVLEALSQCKLVKREIENYPITFDNKGLRDFIQDNFAEENIDWISDVHLTDEMIEQFTRHLEADISDWLKDNWKDFTENRGIEMEMTNYVILHWNSILDIALACDNEGDTMVFDTSKDAKKYAKESFAWNYKIVGIGD